MEQSPRLRADAALARLGLASSREKARALIEAGLVFLDGRPVRKPSEAVPEGAALSVRGDSCPYVSRGGLKLEKALRVFPVEPQDRVCLDVGASTGGFTDVLLRAGARRVYAIDVGTAQLDARLRADPRVTVMEQTNARYLTRENFDERPTLAVMDVSFISVRLILPALADVLGEDGRAVTLIKPQFEAGRERVGKKGVVSDPRTHLEVLETLTGFLPEIGWRAELLDYSPIRGPEGNIEFLAYLSPGEAITWPRETLRALVARAWEAMRG